MRYHCNTSSGQSTRTPFAGGLIAVVLCSMLLTTFDVLAQNQWEVVSTSGMKGGTNIYFPDGTTGFGLGASTGTTWILKTTDGGRKWSGQPWGRALLFGLTSSTDSTIYVTGHWPQCTCAVIMRSIDKGKGWGLDTIQSSFGFYDISFPTPLIGYTGGYNGAILKTADNGETWEQLTTPNTTDVFTDLVFPTAETGYALAGPNGEFYNSSILYRTTDGGASWRLAADFSDVASFNDMLWLNEETGVMIGRANSMPVILRSENGGGNWDEIAVNSDGRSPFALSFADERIGYAVGTGGLILRTTDGGRSWMEEISPTTENIFDVHATGDRVFAVAENNVFLERMDASGVWERGRTDADETVDAALLPLPFSDEMQIVLRNGPPGERYVFALYDQLGREVSRIDDISSETPATIERGDLPGGFYLYRIISSDKKIVADGRIVIR